MPVNAWILAGATATGKSAVCQMIAQKLELPVLSADSMLVYKGMDIGTAKPSVAERGKVPYFGIDLVTPDRTFSTGAWMEAAREAVDRTEGEALIVTGGTGLYIRALTSGLDACEADAGRREHWKRILEEGGVDELRRELRARLPEGSRSAVADDTNPRRLIRALEHLDLSGTLPDNWRREPKPVVVTLTMTRDRLHARIRRRVEKMFEQGLLDETRRLREAYPEWSETASGAIGYAEALAVLRGNMSREEATERICVRTRQLAKRQETWFRHQQNTVWCSVDERGIEATADKVLSLWSEHGTTPIKL